MPTKIHERQVTPLKINTPITLLLIVGLTALLAACQLTVHIPTEAGQNTLPQVASPLPAVVEGLGSVRSYHVTLRYEEHRTLPDGSIAHGLMETNYNWTRSEGPNGYDAHRIVTLGDPQSGTMGVMEETYLVDDLAFTYCSSCPVAADRSGGWSVSKRNESNPPGLLVADVDRLDMTFGVADLAGIPITDLVAQSVVLGKENINGIAATHYQLTNSQALTDTVIMRMAGVPNLPLEITVAQLDLWLTVGDLKPLQYTFKAEGKSESVAGAPIQPFTLLEQYSVTEINSSIKITVPTAVLITVEKQ